MNSRQVVLRAGGRMAVFASDSSRRMLLAVVAVAVAIGVGVSFLNRKHSEWDTVYRAAGQRLLAGENIYTPTTNYAYPPLMAVLAAPFANMPDREARLVWYGVNLVSIGMLLVFGWRASGATHAVTRDTAVFWLGMAVGFPFVLHAVAHQQNDVLVAAIVVVGCYRLMEGHALAAATGFGIAAAMKCTPLLFAPYLLVKGRPAAAAWVVVVAVGANLLPDVVHRPNGATCHLQQWVELFIAPMLKADTATGNWASVILYNQSVVGAAGRWFGDAMPPRELKQWVYGLLAGLAALGLMAMLHGRRTPHAGAWECGMVLSAMLLVSPMSSAPHFATLLLPGWLLARAVIVGRRWRLLPFLAVMVLGAALSNKDLVGATVYTAGLWGGSVMVTAVAGFLGCVVALVDRSGGTPTTGPEVRLVRLAVLKSDRAQSRPTVEAINQFS